MARGRRLKVVWLDILQETQTLVTLTVAIAILHLRNAHSVYFALGATLAAVIAKILKRFFKQPRPTATHKKTYGMPSTHSASIGFMATYLVLCSCYLLPHPRLHRVIKEEHWSWVERSLVAALSCLLALSVWWSRIRLGHHTKAQVIVGGSLGSIVAISAFVLWHGADWLAQTFRSPKISLMKAIPAAGLQERGFLAERALEDLAFITLESWEQRSSRRLVDGVWRTLQTIIS